MAQPPPGLVRVAMRELAWMWHDRVALFLAVGVPLIAFALLSATFSSAVVRDLRVDVVDLDRTQTSAIYAQALNAAPGVAVTRRSSDLTAAMHAVRSGEAIAAVHIPRGLERDMVDGKRPQIVILHNRQYLTPGNIANSALGQAVSAATASLPAGPGGGARYAPGPLVVEQYVLTNPALNYAQYLLRAILPTVLHIVAAAAAGYAVGSEFGARNRGEWLAAAGGDPLTALIGKLAPYFGLFAVLMSLDALILHSAFGVPFRGDSAVVGVAGCLFIAGYLAMGALFQLLVRNLASGLTITAIVCSPAFGFAGVGFPVLAMNDFSRGWGGLLPLRWFIDILFDQAARGVPVADSLLPLAALAGLVLLYGGLGWWRLRSIARRPAPPRLPPARDEARPGLVGAFAAEYRRVLGERAAFGLFVLAPIVYGILYPQPYVGQLIRAIPIAVVDQDSTELSRGIVQALNASEALRVAVRAPTLADAQTALRRREVFGIVDIPDGTERDVLAGRRARLPAYVDSAYFLLYNRTLQGIVEATGAVTRDLASHDARPDGSLARSALARSAPVEVISQPLFNPTGGYGSTIVPAAFALILQQTLLMGAATMGGVAFEREGRAGRRRRGAASAVLGQGLAHLLLVLPGFLLFFLVLPHVYGYAATSHIADLLAMAIPFILSVSFLGQFVGGWFERRETAVLLFITSGLPLLFLVGVSWPVEAIPRALRLASLILPSTSAIDGLVRIDQMDARLADVGQDWMVLWGLAAVYGGLAMLTARLAGREPVAHAV